MGIRFNITSRNNNLAFGKLTWPEKSLEAGAVSGPYGRGELPEGLYHAPRSGLLDKPNDDPYCDSLRQCWFQFLQPQFSTNRTDLGIHPDGNATGTLGCIGLVDSNTKPWYDAFSAVPSGGFVTVEVFNNTLLVAKQLNGANACVLKREDIIHTDQECFSSLSTGFDAAVLEPSSERLVFRLATEVLTNEWHDESYSFTVLENMILQLNCNSSSGRAFVKMYGRYRHFQHPIPTKKLRSTLSGSFGLIDDSGNLLDEWKFKIEWSESNADSGVKQFNVDLGWKPLGGYPLSSVKGLRIFGKDIPV